MIKRIAPLAGALALACAALIGCSDSSVSPTETPAVTTDPYVTLSIDNGSLNTFSEIPNSVDDMMDDPLFLPPPPPDSLHPRDCDRDLGAARDVELRKPARERALVIALHVVADFEHGRRVT